MLIYIQSILVVLLGIFSTISDVKNKKIYNKNIFIFCVISLFFDVIFFNEFEFKNLINYLLNLIISIIISFLFYYFKIWAAGDAKLFIAFCIIIPYSLYEVSIKNIFPSIYLLILIFSIAFIYIVFETIFLWIKDNEKFKLKSEITLNNDWNDFFIQYFLGYFIVLFINNIIISFFEDFKTNNEILIIICNMLFLLLVFKIFKERKKMIIVMLIFIILNIIYYLIYGFELYSYNIKMILFVAVIMVFRVVAEKYNYEEIEIKDLKPRMILAYQSIFMFYGSKVKGLPINTTESTDSRLTQEEVESIKRWSKTKKGKNSLIIVRHMPFAPFMFTGITIFIIFKLFI
jgi:Flp pilus assembly protein protease CpaA